MSIFRSAIDRFARSSPMAQAQKRSALERLLANARYDDPRRLSRFEHQAFSQGGEDGIVREIYRRIGSTTKQFIEIGVGDGLESNTALLMYEDWKGLWIEGSRKSCAAINANFGREIERKNLSLLQAMVTAENVEGLIRENFASTDLDLLSIDVDRNTFYIWKALRNIAARVVVVEYNAMLPSDMNWVTEYDSSKWWNGTSYFGASLKALELLGNEIGYSLVGCDMAGVNAFFVRKDLCVDKFCAPFSAENHYEPVRYYLHCKPGHPRAFRD